MRFKKRRFRCTGPVNFGHQPVSKKYVYEITNDRTRLAGVESLRGIAVALTFLMHFVWFEAATFLTVDVERVNICRDGSLEKTIVCISYASLYGVYIFFMISGFLIGRQWLNRNDLSLFRFLRARAYRIFPAFWVALMGAFLLAVYRSVPISTSAFDWFANAFLINWFAPAISPPWLIVSWSLQVEWIFYLIMPLGALLLKGVPEKYRCVMLWIVTLLLVIALKGIGERHFAYPLYFAIGITLSLTRVEQAKSVVRRTPLALLIALILFIQVAYAFLEPIGTPKAAWQITWFDAFAGAFAMCGGLAFIKCALEPPTWLLGDWLQWLGKHSYSFYLWHLSVLILVFHGANNSEIHASLQQVNWALRWLVLIGVSLLATVAASAASYRMFEAPYFSAVTRGR